MKLTPKMAGLLIQARSNFFRILHMRLSAHRVLWDLELFKDAEKCSIECTALLTGHPRTTNDIAEIARECLYWVDDWHHWSEVQDEDQDIQHNFKRIAEEMFKELENIKKSSGKWYIHYNVYQNTLRPCGARWIDDVYETGEESIRTFGPYISRAEAAVIMPSLTGIDEEDGREWFIDQALGEKK